MFKLFQRFASKPNRSPREEALKDLRRGEFARAECALAELLEVPGLPAHERAFLENKRGVALVSLGQREAAREAFLAAVGASPACAPALTNLGNLALEEGDVALAQSRYEAAIASDDRYAVAHLNLSVAYRQQGRIGDAVRSLRTAQRLEGRSDWKLSKRR